MKPLLISIFGLIGVWSRYLVGSYFWQRFGGSFPWGTLTINIVGSFFIGAVFSTECLKANDTLRVALAVGLLGGFTTFSAFSFETFQMLENGKRAIAVYYVLASVGLGLVATTIGYRIFKGA